MGPPEPRHRPPSPRQPPKRRRTARPIRAPAKGSRKYHTAVDTYISYQATTAAGVDSQDAYLQRPQQINFTNNKYFKDLRQEPKALMYLQSRYDRLFPYRLPVAPMAKQALQTINTLSLQSLKVVMFAERYYPLGTIAAELERIKPAARILRRLSLIAHVGLGCFLELKLVAAPRDVALS